MDSWKEGSMEGCEERWMKGLVDNWIDRWVENVWNCG